MWLLGEAMKQSIEEYLEDYNQAWATNCVSECPRQRPELEHRQVFSITMPLVMFLDACEHCAGVSLFDASFCSCAVVSVFGCGCAQHGSAEARICRVLSQPNGNVLLLGVGNGPISLNDSSLASAFASSWCEVEAAGRVSLACMFLRKTNTQ